MIKNMGKTKSYCPILKEEKVEFDFSTIRYFKKNTANSQIVL